MNIKCNIYLCAQFVGGTYTTKRVFSLEEAQEESPGSITQHKTGWNYIWLLRRMLYD